MISKANSDWDDLRRNQYSGASDLANTLREIELNIASGCNRSCNFCPQSLSNYIPGSKGIMKVKTAKRLAKLMRDSNYSQKISIAGFGEPLLHKKLDTIIEIFATQTNAQTIEIVTNGDYLTEARFSDLVNAGITGITVSMYDNDISGQFSQLCDHHSIKGVFKHLYNGFDIVSRNEMVQEIEIIDNSNLESACFYPSYKLFVDVDGTFRLCCNDWGAKTDFGNVFGIESLLEFWLEGPISHHREHLIRGRRANEPCGNCDVGGTRYGADSANVFLNIDKTKK